MNSPLMMLSLIMLIPFLGMLFVLTSKENETSGYHNSSNVAVFTIIANIVMIWQMFAFVKDNNAGMQLVEKIKWLSYPDISLVFAVDNMSLLLILAAHLIMLCGIVFVRGEYAKQKSMMTFSLLLLSMITGLFISNDIFSFFYEFVIIL